MVYRLAVRKLSISIENSYCKDFEIIKICIETEKIILFSGVQKMESCLEMMILNENCELYNEVTSLLKTQDQSRFRSVTGTKYFIGEFWIILKNKLSQEYLAFVKPLNTKPDIWWRNNIDLLKNFISLNKTRKELNIIQKVRWMKAYWNQIKFKIFFSNNHFKAVLFISNL